MDTATQFLLGASVSGALLGPKLGARALLVGGAVATLPDLDSFIPYGNAIDAMTRHRGFSHSFFVQTLVAPVITVGLTRFVTGTREIIPRLLVTVWLCLVTHSLLDTLTTYGTQIFWPLRAPPAAFPSVFIIDPAYSAMLLAGVLGFFFLRRRRSTGVRVNRILLALGTLYLGIGMAGQVSVKARAASHPAFADMRIHVQPAPFTILFWQVLGVSETQYATGLTSLVPGCGMTQIAFHERRARPPTGISPSPTVRRLEWFTDGFYTYHVTDNAVAITDLRLGVHPSFPFSFIIARAQSADYAPIDPVQTALGPDRGDQLLDLYRAAWRSLDSCGR